MIDGQKKTILVVLAAVFAVVLFAPPVFASENGDSDFEDGNGSHAFAAAYASAYASAYAAAFNLQGQFQAQTLESTFNQATPDLSKLPGTPASVYVQQCTQGASGSGPGYGGSVGSGDRFCLLLQLAGFYWNIGNQETAKALANEAYEELNRRGAGRIVRFLHLDEVPVLSFVARHLF